MINFACFRLPYADDYTIVSSEQKVKLIASYEAIGKESGFVVAPFNPDYSSPIVLIHPDKVEKKSFGVVSELPNNEKETDSEEKNFNTDYASAFQKFHGAINEGRFMKLVLSCSCTRPADTSDAEALFLETCRRYPRLAVMLVSTERTGTWLVASPEILLTGDGSWWRTMALAGTMPYADGYQEWSEKNQHEQHFVEAYIEDRLSDYSLEILKDGPHTRRAGNLVHLCTDFRFHLAPGCYIGEVLASLHPTPAVCGIPKAKAREFILENENNNRLYYSGFMGPVGIDGETHLYVSLRCAKLEEGNAILYAGGGIMPESTMQSEWEEVEHKMKTIGNVLK